MHAAWRWIFQGCLTAAPLILQAPAAFAAPAESGPLLPAIKQVAVMPVYWQGSFPEGQSFIAMRPQLDQTFSKLARASKRFSLNNDVVTADLWSTPEGRQELAEEYEIDGLLNLTVTGQPDLMLWTVRLLSPQLQNYLSENERIPYAWYQAASPEEIEARLQKLLFRMLNRYPIDVFVTSIQGRYVTLSSGSEQNVFEGDELKFYATTLKSQHPVDNSWLSFEQKLLGKAKVIESKSESSIATITSLSYENALKVGDGAKVEAIATRRNFQQLPAEQQRYVAVDKNSAIVEPTGDWQKPMHQPKPPIAAVPLPRQEPVKKPAPPVIAQIEAPVPQENPPPPADAAPPSMAASSEEPPSLADIMPFKFREYNFAALTENLSFGGTAKMSSKTPAYFLNRLQATGMQDINQQWEGRIGAILRLGDAKKGEYRGLAAQGEGLYKIPFLNANVPSLNQILVGGLLRMETLSVTKESFGGWDVASFGPSVHLVGSHHVPDWVKTIDYDIGLRYFLSATGSSGSNGKRREIRSGQAFELEANAVARGQAHEVEWGGLFSYHSGSWGLSKGTLSPEFFAVGVIGRMRL